MRFNQYILNLALDPVVNFGKVTVSTGYTTDTIITVNTGDGAKLPDPSIDGSFNLVWWNWSDHPDPSDDPNVEIVRCISRTGDVLTIMRMQEGTAISNKNLIGRTYKMILSPTKKIFTDIASDVQSRVDAHSTLSTGVHGVGIDTLDGISARNSAIASHTITTSNVHNFDSLGNAPPQVHSIEAHTGTIGAEGNITFAATGGHSHTGSDSTKVDHTNLLNKGTNSHTDIDTHIGSSSGVHGVGLDTVDGVSARNGAIGTHAAITSNVHNFDSSGNAPAQTHGIDKHTGNIGTESNITFATTGGHGHTGSDSTKVDHINLLNKGTNTHAQIDTSITNSISHIAASSAHGTSSAIVGASDTQTLTNKTITDSTNNVTAKSLKSATTTVDISAATAPTVGQVLTAIGSAAATWQTLPAGTSPATSVVSETSFSQASAVGTSNLYARGDHTHGTPSDTPFEHIIYKNQPSGYAGLNSNGLLWPYQIYPSLEEYSNHLGAVDNFTQTVLVGNGTATSDAANHQMTLSSGLTVASYSTFDTKKTWTLGTNPIVVNVLVQNINAGGTGSLCTQVGLSGVFGVSYGTMLTTGSSVCFKQDPGGSWYAHTANGSNFNDISISLANGNLATVVATSSMAYFYVNGSLVASTNLYLPTGVGLNIGTGIGVGSGITTARTISVDMFSIKVYK